MMIFIGTLFCNLLEDAMRLHLQPRLDMTSVASSRLTYLHALPCLPTFYMSLADLPYMAAFFSLSPLPHYSPALHRSVCQ